VHQLHGQCRWMKIWNSASFIMPRSLEGNQGALHSIGRPPSTLKGAVWKMRTPGWGQRVPTRALEVMEHFPPVLGGAAPGLV
jgi:hypothetical protein